MEIYYKILQQTEVRKSGFTEFSTCEFINMTNFGWSTMPGNIKET